MLINIDDNFTLNVPRFTDEYKDLVKLYKLNFGGWKFDNDIYNTLSNKIIDSKNPKMLPSKKKSRNGEFISAFN